jgi:hypothetical protein
MWLRSSLRQAMGHEESLRRQSPFDATLFDLAHLESTAVAMFDAKALYLTDHLNLSGPGGRFRCSSNHSAWQA